MRLNNKIILLIIVVAAGIGLSSGLFASRIMQGIAETELKERANLIVQITAENIVRYVIDQNVLSTKELLQKIINDNKDIDYAYVVGFSGEIFAYTFEGNFPRDLWLSIHEAPLLEKPHIDRYSTSEGVIMDVGYPLIKGMPARFHIGMNESLSLSQATAIRNRILSITLIVTLIGTLFGIFLSRRITLPLGRLVESMHSFGKGKAEKPISFNVGGHEVEELTTAFNRMMYDRKQAEKALHEAYSIINRSPAVAFLWKNQAGWPVEFVSDNVVELFGYSAEEFTSGQVSYAKTVHPDDLERVVDEVVTFSNDKKRIGFVHKPYRIIAKDGKVRWLDDRTYIRRDNEETITHYEGIVVDITDSMQAARALRESEEKLVRSKKMESLGLLAGGVAHDLNNVLSGIVSYPELLLLDLPGDSQFKKAIETIKESGDRAVAIVQDLLTVARGVATTKEPLNLNDQIGDYLHSPEFNMLKQFHPTVTIKTNLDTDLLNISGSPAHIRKMVMNLVSNASEAIKGSGNVTISTVNRYLDTPLRRYDDIKSGEYAVLTVSDDGSGISSDDLERIFEPFYTKKVMGRSGTGLGLAVVWNVVQDHRGYIDVISNQDGTTFELFFPITREEISDRDLPIPYKNLKGDGEKVLVIDDVESQRHISCKVLETFGYQTKDVSSGEEAVEYLKENAVDLILLDMIMDPGINGRETYERIIKIHPNQKAIIVSGFAETDEVKKTQKLGAGKFIKKPLTLEKIGLAVKEEMER